MIATKLQPVDTYMAEVQREGWVPVLLGMIDAYESEPNPGCLEEYNNFWNQIVFKMIDLGHGLSRDAFRKLIRLREAKR